jgi:hypothetical protein
MRRLYPRPDAAEYLGMSARSFDAMVAPYVPYVLVGKTGKRYDAKDLDAWVDAQIKIDPAGVGARSETCEKQTRRAGYGSAAKSGTSIGRSESAAITSSFENLLDAARSRTHRR